MGLGRWVHQGLSGGGGVVHVVLWYTLRHGRRGRMVWGVWDGGRMRCMGEENTWSRECGMGEEDTWYREYGMGEGELVQGVWEGEEDTWYRSMGWERRIHDTGVCRTVHCVSQARAYVWACTCARLCRCVLCVRTWVHSVPGGTLCARSRTSGGSLAGIVVEGTPVTNADVPDRTKVHSRAHTHTRRPHERGASCAVWWWRALGIDDAGGGVVFWARPVLVMTGDGMCCMRACMGRTGVSVVRANCMTMASLVVSVRLRRERRVDGLTHLFVGQLHPQTRVDAQPNGRTDHHQRHHCRPGPAGSPILAREPVVRPA